MLLDGKYFYYAGYVLQYSISCDNVPKDFGGQISLYTDVTYEEEGCKNTVNFESNQFEIVLSIKQQTAHIAPLIKQNCEYSKIAFQTILIFVWAELSKHFLQE